MLKLIGMIVVVVLAFIAGHESDASRSTRSSPYKKEEHGSAAGLAYGMLLPFNRLSCPQAIYRSDAQTVSPAQAFQVRLAVKF